MVITANYKKKCEICCDTLFCRWTDYHGEGVCETCGTPYQLINGTEEQKKENNYPYLKLKKEWIPIVKEYWDKTQQFVFHGTSMSETTGLIEFWKWVEDNHPEMMKEDK